MEPAIATLERIGRRMWGFPPNLMGPIVDQLGPLDSLGWFVRNMPKYERTLNKYGPLRTHLSALTISLVNGCPYCSYGHALAFELAYFKAFDAPFLLDEEQLVSLHGQDPTVIAQQIGVALDEARVGQEGEWMERTLELCAGADPESPDDHRLAHLVSMLGVLNKCAIAANTPRDQAHDRLNKDSELKARYLAARGSRSD